jgi:hypothetical protein
MWGMSSVAVPGGTWMAEANTSALAGNWELSWWALGVDALEHGDPEYGQSA